MDETIGAIAKTYLSLGCNSSQQRDKVIKSLMSSAAGRNHPLSKSQIMYRTNFFRVEYLSIIKYEVCPGRISQILLAEDVARRDALHCHLSSPHDCLLGSKGELKAIMEQVFDVALSLYPKTELWKHFQRKNGSPQRHMQEIVKEVDLDGFVTVISERKVATAESEIDGYDENYNKIELRSKQIEM